MLLLNFWKLTGKKVNERTKRKVDVGYRDVYVAVYPFDAKGDDNEQCAILMIWGL